MPALICSHKMVLIAALPLLLAACNQSPTSPSSPTAPPPVTGLGPTTSPAGVTPPRISRTRYLAFGDSLTAGTTSPAVTTMRAMDAGLPQSYPFKLQALLRARYTTQTIDVINEGRPGEAAQDAARRFPTVLRTVAPEVVILLHGVNDVTFLGRAGVQRTADYLNTMAREARLYGTRVMLCTLLPQRPSGFRAADPAALAAYNRAVRDIAHGEGAILIDFEALGFDVRLIGVDGLHPTEEGFVRMSQLIFDQVRTSFEMAR